ncbi:hypothetical protein F5X68DRAFT_152660 [Plectosphaerella plurivora]|uniref:AMP-activated protein kinase glycogen-binding domain-containing protein n=1 Tax=Plectosphaerella plurivora TaxID=936078 RepID=A0A9P8VBQ7_9PEZI|nr:hypothetical protein F5X68DRAFT_152660 [Plectosphaerella plurivora]
MADHSKIPIAITYHKPGTEPPLFVAGSFSNWEPQEMDCTTDEDGKHVFVKTVRVPPGTEIQYKFRVGQGDWWVLNDEAPTATDEAGNLNNIMTAPGPESPLKLKPLAHLQEAERQRLSSTPIGQVADTAAEVADTAEKLDGDKLDEAPPQTASKPQQPEGVPSFKNVLVTPADDEDEGPPLFSHECPGAVEFGDDDDEPPRSPLLEQEERSHHGSVDYDLDKYDLNDPTLERWPSNDRRSIYDAVRKVETGTNEDQTFFLGSPVSPLVGARRLSMDDEAIDTSAPASPLLAKKLDVPVSRKKSHSSVVSNKSLTSLAAIVEEGGRQRAAAAEEPTEERTGPPAISVPNPSTQAPEAHRSPASDDDEGVALRSSRKPAPAIDTDNTASAQVCTDPDSRGPPRPSSADPPRPPLPAETGPTQSKAQAGALPDEMDELDDTDEDEAPIPDSRVQRREGKDVTRGNWLPAFFRVLFYDWIGGFFGRLFRGQGKAK